MNTQELVGLTHWIDEEIKSRQIVSLYTQLVEILQNNVNSTPARSFNAEKEALIHALRDVDVFRLSHEQREFVKKLGLAEHVGVPGVAELEGLLFKNVLDISTAWTRAQAIRDAIQTAVSRSEQIQAGLVGLVELDDETDSQVLVRVVFEGAASIENIVSLKKWAAEWHDIGRGIAMAHDLPPEEVRVVGAQRGSIILVLATTYAIASTVAIVLLKSLEVTQKVLTIRKTVEEIKALKLGNEKIALDLEASIASERTKGIERIAGDVSESVDGNVAGEKAVALQKAVKKLVSFLEKGGQVDLVLPLDEDNVEVTADDPNVQMKELRANVHQIRTLEDQVKLLESNPANDD